MTNTEIKDIKGFEGLYKVTSDGKVYSVRSKIFLKPRIKEEYETLKLTVNYKRKSFSVHRLVAAAFLENDLELETVNHKDGNKLNNHVSNLEWCSRPDNIKHAYRTNLMARGTQRKSKLTEDDVREIRFLTSQGTLTYKEIADRYNICAHTAWTVGTKRKWRHIQ